MATYTGAVDLAHRLLTAKGVAVTVQQRTQSTYDPVTDTYGSGGFGPAVGVSAVIDQPSGQERAFVEGAVSALRAIELLVPAKGLAITPAEGDRWTVAGTVYTATGVTTIRPGGVAILYEVIAEVAG